MSEKDYKISLEIELSAENPLHAVETFINWLKDDANDMVYYVQDSETSETFSVDMSEPDDSEKVLPAIHKPLIQMPVSERERINKAASSYLSEQHEGDLYDAYQRLEAASDDGKGDDMAAWYAVIWQPLENLSVDEVLELIDSSKETLFS